VKEVPKWNLNTAVVVRKEASILHRLDHPCVCKIFETFEDDSNIYLVMEFIDGRTLFQEVMENVKMKCFDEPRYAAIMGQVFGALCYLHGHDVLHRDLKPENIMVCQLTKDPSRPNIKIIDFGFAMQTQAASSTKDGMGVVSAYLAPETRDCWRFTPASDMWSIGVIIFLMFQGRFPISVLAQQEVKEVSSANARNLLESLLQEDPKKTTSSFRCHTASLGAGPLLCIE